MSTITERVRAKTGFDTTQISDTDMDIFIEEAKIMYEKLTGSNYLSTIMSDAIISDFVSGLAYNRVNGVEGIRSYKLGKLSVSKFDTWDGINFFFNEGLKKLKEYIGVMIKKTEYMEEEITKPDKITKLSGEI